LGDPVLMVDGVGVAGRPPPYWRTSAGATGVLTVRFGRGPAWRARASAPLGAAMPTVRRRLSSDALV
jgi:hypothetical protein